MESFAFSLSCPKMVVYACDPTMTLIISDNRLNNLASNIKHFASRAVALVALSFCIGIARRGRRNGVGRWLDLSCPNFAMEYA